MINDQQPTQEISTLVVLFGITGDLASRNIIPALYRLYRRDILAEHFAVIGTGRTKAEDFDLNHLVIEALADEEPNDVNNFLEHLFYQTADVTKKEDYDKLKERIVSLREKFEIDDLNVYHLSISPSLFSDTTTYLAESGIASKENGDHRIIIEKPFGDDTETARQLNADINEHFDENQIYRIDHYLGMEMVQNIIATRHYNKFIGNLWDKNSIDNIQITFKEDQSIGSRGGYYDAYGAFLDLFQNHILQVLALTGMEDPDDLSSNAIHQAKVDFFKTIDDFSKEDVENNIILGQYGADPAGNFNAYRDEDKVEPDSMTDTYFAGKIESSADRWEDVPFYFRHGKALDETFAVVSLVLKTNEKSEEGNNLITFYVRPHEGVKVVLNQKAFGQEFTPATTFLDAEPVGEYEATEYEKLIFDVLLDDHSFFVTWEEIEQQWRITDSIRAQFDKLDTPEFPNYKAGDRGPIEADQLLDRDNRIWIEK